MREEGLPEREWRGYRINQRLPDDFDPAAATMIITWRETLSYLTRMVKTLKDETFGYSLLVIGSGGNGLAFAAHGHKHGATTVVVLGSAARKDTARAVGATDTFDYRATDVIARIGQAYPEGFDFIIDAVGKAGQLDAALPLLKPGGAVGIYGIDDWGSCTLTPTRARGTFTFYNGGYDEEETHEQVVADIQTGKLKAEHWLDLRHPFALSDINQAFEALRERKMVKALVRLS
jgi:threonine dehydrogenase-like Zn-dependent dehydrogenase